MVECEYALCDVSSDVRTVLIDTWWNVNEDFNVSDFLKILVLIDTWWNVNKSRQRYLKRENVLIDTWWNVNVRDEIIFDFANQSFNRYMVECEYPQL